MQIKKRNGSVQDFNTDKIRGAIKKAFDATETPYNEYILCDLALKVVSDFAPKVVQGVVSVEDIQDSVERVLIKAEYSSVAKAYILYRKQHEKIRNAETTIINYKDTVDKYLNSSDWRVKENSTVTYSVGGLMLSNSGAITANYWLSEIYDEEVANAHRNADIHIHDLSMLTGYCAGWSLKQLIQEGLGGIPGKITSAPASHLSTLCNQMVNFLGIMQNEWAGAQAFSSFDTYLAPFIKADNLSYKEVKQCIQSFVFGVNTPSRWGCVDEKTEVLSVDGFKKYNELKEGDLIYTWNAGRMELNPVRKVITKPFKGLLHSYRGRGYDQTVTPNHRVLIKKFNCNEYEIKHSEDIFNSPTPYALPVAFYSSDIDNSKLTDDEIRLAAMFYTDGSIDMRNNSVHKIMLFKSPNRQGNEDIRDVCRALGLKYKTHVHNGEFGSKVNAYFFYGDSARRIIDLVGCKERIDNRFMAMNSRQANLFLSTWARFDGNKYKLRCQYDNDTIRDQLQQIALLAGHTSYVWTRRKTNYVKIRKCNNVTPTERVAIDYDGIVWCPNVENGTAVFRKNGCVYISGQTQAPFSNITLDWTVPDDLAELNCIVGGKEVGFKYKDCQKEIDMINKAFIEVMIEGDANGRGFQYPIPTYSITKDFDWSETENNKLLFEMTAKYGTPYFSNYVNSDMQPSDVRSMAILGTQELFYKDADGVITKNEIRHIFDNWNRFPENNKPNYRILMNGDFVPVIDMFQVPYDKYDKYVKFTMSTGIKQSFSWEHKCPVIRNGKYMEIESQDVVVGDKMLIARHPMEGPQIGTYEAGQILGYYIAEGWHSHDRELSFAININRKDIVNNIVSFFTNMGQRCKIEQQTEKNIYKVVVFGEAAVGFADNFIDGEKAIEKRFKKNLWNTSKEFRQGVYDGYLDTDGSRKNKVFAHTTNKDLCVDLYYLAATLGIPMKYQTNNNNTRYFKADKSDKIHFKSYKLLNITPEIYNDNYYLSEVTEIEYPETTANKVYNFTVDTVEHLYELPNGIITHQCCRLRLDLRELRKKSGGFFGSGESTGSVGVVTINMPRIAYLSKNENDFYKRLDHIMDISARSLKTKRTVITRLLDAGLYPYTKRYLGTLDNHFSTIGLVGMNEACLNASWIKKDLTVKKAQDFTKKVLNHMRERLSDYQEAYGDLYNLEATPAESTSYRLAKHDAARYPEIITANMESTPYYTNSSHLPVGYTDDVFSALDIQDELQTLYTSGTVFHTFLGEKLPSWQAAASLVRKIAENYRLPYYTISPTYSVCKNHGYINGETYKCSECGESTEVYSRITGYYRPVQHWNEGKSQEYKDRKVYEIHELLETFDDKNFTESNECECCKIDFSEPDKVYLFATKTCPNCKIAETFLIKNNISFEKLYAEDNIDMAKKYNLTQAPTLVLDSGTRLDKYVGVSNIKRYVDYLTSLNKK